jgi:hypothetical protein
VGNGDEERRDARSDCVRVWQTLVRPALEYGAAVWGECVWEEAERIQREMARMILKCSPKMTNEAVLGQTSEASVCRESKETRGRKAEQVVR